MTLFCLTVSVGSALANIPKVKVIRNPQFEGELYYIETPKLLHNISFGISVTLYIGKSVPFPSILLCVPSRKMTILGPRCYVLYSVQ